MIPQTPDRARSCPVESTQSSHQHPRSVQRRDRADLVQEALDFAFLSPLLVLERIRFVAVKVWLSRTRYEKAGKTGVVPDRQDVLERTKADRGEGSVGYRMREVKWRGGFCSERGLYRRLRVDLRPTREPSRTSSRKRTLARSRFHRSSDRQRTRLGTPLELGATPSRRPFPHSALPISTVPDFDGPICTRRRHIAPSSTWIDAETHGGAEMGDSAERLYAARRAVSSSTHHVIYITDLDLLPSA